MEISRKNFATYIDSFYLHHNEKKTIEYNLNPQKGMLTVHSDPEGAEVYINGKKFGTTPFNDSLNAGIHDIKIKMKDHKTPEKQIEIKKDEQTRLDVPLTNFTYKMKPYRIIGWASTGVAAAGLVSGTYFMISSRRAYNKYHDATDDATKLGTRIRRADRYWPTALIVGSIAAIPAVYFNLKTAKMKRNFNITAAPVPNGGILVFNFTF